MYDELSEDYLIGLERMLRDYLINDKITKEEMKDIMSKPHKEFVDYVNNYKLRVKS